MKKNVFLKSILRQPIRAIVLVVLMAAAAFAFAARAVEYVVVSNELDRIEGFYRSVGVLSPINPRNFSEDHNTAEAAALIGQDSRVAVNDRRAFAQGVMDGLFNTVSRVVRWNTLTLHLEGVDVRSREFYFYGTLVNRPRFTNFNGGPAVFFTVEADYLVMGDPAVMRTEVIEIELPPRAEGMAPMTARLDNWVDLVLPIAPGTENPLANIEIGGQYLFRAFPVCATSLGAPDSRTQWIATALEGDDGIRSRLIPGSAATMGVLVDPSLADANLIYYVSTADKEAMDAVLSRIQPDLDTLSENLHSLMVTGTQDMALMPRTQMGGFTLTQGRFIDYYDNANQNPVALISQSLALRNGLEIGDTITITLRDLPRPGWIDRPTDSPWALGLEGWWASLAQPWWPTIEAPPFAGTVTSVPAAINVLAKHGIIRSPDFWIDHYGDTENLDWLILNTANRILELENTDEIIDWREHTTMEIELELVGFFWTNPFTGSLNNFHASEMFVPSSIMPQGFGWDDMLLSGMYSFSLASPRYEDMFFDENWEAVHALGFTVNFLDSGVRNFWASADPIRVSIFVNLAVFTAAAALILALAAFLYIRQGRRVFAISRALGVPAKSALIQMFIPVAFMWLPAVAIGSVGAWFFALDRAQSALAAVAGYDASAGLSLVWLFILMGGVMIAALLTVLFGGTSLARRNVLELLQGRAAKVRRKKISDSPPADFNLDFTVIQALDPSAVSKASRRSGGARFIFRHIIRSPVRSALAAGLALFFLVSLGWLNHTIEFTETEIGRLYDTTIVTAEITRDPRDERLFGAWGMAMGSLLSEETLDEVMRDSFVQSVYLEAGWPRNFLLPPNPDGSFRDDLFEELNNLTFRDYDWIFAVNNLTEFISDNTRRPMDDQLGVWGDDLSIDFAPGFGQSDFYQWEAYIPVIVREDFLEQRGLELGHSAYAAYGPARVPVRVIGVFDGGLSRGVNRFDGANTVIMPIDGLEYIISHDMVFAWTALGWEYIPSEAQMLYMTARITIDPARNRELAAFNSSAQAPLSQNAPAEALRIGQVPMLLSINDEILYNVVEPMEQNLVLLRLLYPIAIALSVVIAAGISALLMLQNAKNAAILRILGTTKHRARLLLCAEQLVVTIAGISLGLAVLPLIGADFASAILLFSGLYLSSAIIGGIAGAVVISGRPPLELLQVRE